MTLSHSKPWYVYIILCNDNTYYTGITTDIARRIEEHNSSRRGAKYTRARRPVKLAYSEPHSSRSTASKREHAIKKFSLTAKRRLIAKSTHNN